MIPAGAIRQRGAALLALLAVIALAASWFLVKQLNTESGAIAAARTNRNAVVLNKAKQALIGYIAAQAAKDGENNPGAIPCPENPGDFDSTTGRQGLVGTSCGTTTIGRFPWRTLGLDRLVDSSGEPLWYVVGPGWGVATGSNTVINSNSVGQLAVDGVPNSAVALLIAPGPAFSAAAAPAAGCSAWSQVRLPTGTPDWRNYLECENASSPANATFVTTGPSGSFNDQVVTITVADVLPAIEAAIASRIEREIAPQLRTAYSGGSWSGASTAPALPFAALFADPSISAMQGVFVAAGLPNQGLLPLTHSETSPTSGVPCTPGVSDPRCDPNFVLWTSASISVSGFVPISPVACSTTTPSQVNCTYYYQCFLWMCGVPGGTITSFTITAVASNVGMAMRQLNANAAITNINPGSVTFSPSASLNSDGSATVNISATTTPPATGSLLSNLLCGISGFWSFFIGCAQHTVSVPITVLADHPLLDASATGVGASGWFLRNRWHEVAYYATASGFAPNGAKSCTPNTTCLTVAYHRDATGAVDAGRQRAIIVLAGRALTGQTRPTAVPTDYLEGANTGSDLSFEVRSAALTNNRSFNDRIAVLDSEP